MTRLTASQLREDMATAINKVAFGGERIVLQRNNKDVAALVPMEDLTLAGIRNAVQILGRRR